MNDARDLTSRLADLLRREHHALADFLALADFDRERRWLELGYTSCLSHHAGEPGRGGAAVFPRL